MIEFDEGTFSFILINFWLSQFLYIASILYRFATFKILKLKRLGSLFSFFIPPIALLMAIYIPHHEFFNLIFPTIGAFCLLFDFFQNYKKCYLCTYSSLLMAHLCILISLGTLFALKSVFFFYFIFANFFLAILFFAKKSRFTGTIFKKSLCLSFFVSLLIFCTTWFKPHYGEFLLLSYLTLYFALSAYVIVSISLLLCLNTIKWYRSKQNNGTPQ